MDVDWIETERRQECLTDLSVQRPCTFEDCLMDEVSEILTQLEKTIRSDKVFADAHIYHWGETPSDLPVEDFTVPSIYMKVLKPMIPDSDFHLDIRYWWPLIERVSYRRWSINHHVI